MVLKEMMEDMQKGQNMLLIAVSLGFPKIIDNHVSNFFAAVLLGQKVLSERCCSDFGEVLMLCNSEHLFFAQTAQSNAIFKRDQVSQLSCYEQRRQIPLDEFKRHGRFWIKLNRPKTFIPAVRTAPRVPHLCFIHELRFFGSNQFLTAAVTLCAESGPASEGN